MNEGAGELMGRRRFLVWVGMPRSEVAVCQGHALSNDRNEAETKGL